MLKRKKEKNVAVRREKIEKGEGEVLKARVGEKTGYRANAYELAMVVRQN